jgi:ribonucleotide reductase alpha subunit
MVENKTYVMDEVVKSSVDYFKGDELSAKVWVNKYALKDSFGNIYEQNPDDMHWRLANEIARIEQKYPNSLTADELFDLMRNFKYIVPQGSPMTGIGNNFQIASLSNCFVIGVDGKSDSYGGIMKIDEEQVQLMKRRGGVGNDLSHIRPNGSPVKNSALTSTGVVPFMERYSNSTREVAQDGRRGALMLSISVKHPDAESFIDAKLEQGKITGANVSVKMHDDFMNAVINKQNYIQKYPIDSSNPQFKKEINAEKLWKKIIHNAWKSAEPGVLFWDTIIKESLPDCYADLGYKTVSTNPCFPSSENLLTDKGYVKFGDLFNRGKENIVVCDNRIKYNDNGVEKVENWFIDNELTGTINRKASHVFLTQKNAEIIELKTKRGFSIKCTPDHHIATTIGMVEAKDLTNEHKILIAIPNNEGSIIDLEPNTTLEHLSMLIGLITGDGTFDKSRSRVHLDFYGVDADRIVNKVLKSIEYLKNEFGDITNVKNRNLSTFFITKTDKKTRITSAWLSEILNKYGFNRDTKGIVPQFIMENSATNIGKYYLAGLFYTDGSFQGTKNKGYSIRLSQSNRNLLQSVQLILHSNGIITNLHKRRDSKLKSLPDGKGGYKEYLTKTNYDLITKDGSIVNYCNKIGFLGHIEKENKMKVNHNFRVNNNLTDTVIDIIKCGNEDVYCIKEDIGRNIIVNGISTRRCGEIPLCPYDSCRLLALNLYSYVNNPFTDKAEFDFDLFKKHSQIAQKIMDDIIDLEIEKVDKILEKIKSDPESPDIKLTEEQLWLKIKDKTEKGRRTGVGITAEGDMLAALGLRYGTEEATNFSELVHKTLAIEAYRSSVIMAKERGSFTIYDTEREKTNPFILRLKDADNELYNNMIKYGRRNIACLTIAPTGTTSMMTQTTSGIEPVFMPVYTRRRKVNPNDKNHKIDFVDEVGDSWEEFNVFHHKFLTWMEINGYDINKKYTQSEIDDIVKLSPYYKATSGDIDWLQKVHMQGKIQKWVDHSISVTINLPNDATEELVGNLYIEAWKSGCKGCTVYRDGSRSGVLISNNDKTKNTDSDKIGHAEKRPKILKAKVVKFNNGGEKWVSVVGLLKEKPYEIFTGLLDKLNIPKYVEEGWVIKNMVEGTFSDEFGIETKKMVSRYDFGYKDKDGTNIIIEGLSTTFKQEYWNYAKLISGLLRHNMPLEYLIKVIKTLNLGEENINNWKNGVIRTLKKFINDGVIIPEKCSKCGGNLVMESGCNVCKDCGHSKCE